MDADERRIIDARVIVWSGDRYGVALTFNDGSQSAVSVGSKNAAEAAALAAIGQLDAFVEVLHDKARSEN